MSSFLTRAKYATNNMTPVRTGYGIDGHGPLGFVVDKGERYGAAFGFGALKGYYREKFVKRGVGLDLWIGGALTLLSAALSMLSGGRSSIAPHIERIGDAGVSSYLNSMGAAWGTRKSGREVYVLSAGSPRPAQLPAGMSKSVIGEIPPIPSGAAYLTPDEIAFFSGPR